MNKRLMFVLPGLVIAMSMVLAACGPAATPTTAPVVMTEPPTAAPVATEVRPRLRL